MTISLKNHLYAPILNSTNLTGVPTINNNPILSVTSNGEIQALGSPILLKTREYSLPTSWYGIAEYSKEEFDKEISYYGYGYDVFPQISSTVIYIDPTATTNGIGTLTNPYNTLPSVIQNDTLVLFKEYTTFIVSTTISITASNVILGTYDTISGERVIDFSRLASISYTSMAKLFNYSIANSSFTLSGLKFEYIGTTQNYNRVINNSVNSIQINIEYCLFSNIDSLIGTVLSSVIETTGTSHIRFNKFHECIAHGIVSYGKQAKIYGNEMIYNNTNAVIAIKLSSINTAGNFDVHRNFILNKSNISSLISIANTTLGTSIIRKNYLFGGIGSQTTSSYNILCTGLGSSKIYDNIVVNSTTGISAIDGISAIYRNIVCSEYIAFYGIIGATIIGNTVIKLKEIGGVAITATVSANSNIVDAGNSAEFITAFVVENTTTVTYNNINRASNQVLLSTGSSNAVDATNRTTTSGLDYKFFPTSLSQAIGTGQKNTTYGLYGNRGAKQNIISGIGATSDLFSPSNGISTLLSLCDSKAPLVNANLTGNVYINNYKPNITIVNDNNISASKTVSGINTAIVGNYSYPSIYNVKCNILYSQIGSSTINIIVNGTTIYTTTTQNITNTFKVIQIFLFNKNTTLSGYYISGMEVMPFNPITIAPMTTIEIEFVGTQSSETILQHCLIESI